jgi:hypothetical protein
LRLFCGEIECNNNKTFIHGKFKHSLFVGIFLITWFGGVIVIGGMIFLGGLLGILSKTQEIGKSILSIVILPLMLGYGVFIFEFGRKKKEEWLIDLIKEKFELRENEKSD